MWVSRIGTRAGVLPLVLLFGQSIHAAEVRPAPGDGPPSAVEEILVTGEHPGPGLWKISKGSHTMHILGTHAPLPAQLVWQSKEVESAIAQSHTILGAYAVVLRVERSDALNARGKRLRQVLPQRAYAKWRALAKRHIKNPDQAERLLPAEAALLLQSEAYEQNGLTYTDDVWRTIHLIASKHRVPIWPQTYEFDPPANASDRRSTSGKSGVNYLIETMDRLDVDIREARARANAWAVGDVAALKVLAESDASYANSLAYSWPFLKEGEVRSLRTQAENKLLAAIERAVNQNETTFAALPIHLLLGKNGFIEKLRALGYRIEEPR